MIKDRLEQKRNNGATSDERAMDPRDSAYSVLNFRGPHGNFREHAYVKVITYSS